MLVDPNTGMPMDAYGTRSWANTIAGEYGFNPTSNHRLFNVMQTMPNAHDMAGWNAWRASRTITHGGFTKTGLGGKWRNHLTPRSWTRFTSGNVITGANDTYSPFNFMAEKGDWLARKMVSSSFFGDKTQAAFGKMGLMDEGFSADSKGYFFSGGTYAGLSGAMSLSLNGSARKIGKATKFVQSQDSALFEAAGRGGFSMGLTGSARDVAGLVTAVPQGRFSQAIGGWMAGSRGLVSGEQITALESLRPAWAAAARSATGVIEGAGLKVGERIGLSAASDLIGSAALKGAGVVAADWIGAAIPGVNVLLAAKTAYDVTRMGMKAMEGSLEFGRDAMVSFRGDVSKPVMGMGYKDNTVAATSRARGVMAIQNSQLNARSVIGNEAAGMAAHFG